MALNNLGIRYSELGRRAEALAPTEEAVDIYRALAADNPAFLPDLAARPEQPRHLLQRGWAGAPRRCPPPRKPSTLYRALAADNPAFLPDLASALNNLGICYSGLGRRAEALPPPRKPSTSTARWPPTTPPSCPTSPRP